MFWRKRKPQEMKPAESLVQLATKLGVERRLNVRVKYPPHMLCKLPEVFYSKQPLKVHDISVGGCCVLDPLLLLGPEVGHDIELEMHWPTGIEYVKARIVSRVDHRRHMQFLNLSKNRQVFLTKAITAGVRGLSLRHHGFHHRTTVEVQAREMWSSPFGDSVVLENGVHRIAQIHLLNELFHVFRDAWPQKVPGGRSNRSDFEHLILFLSNIPQPSSQLKHLINA